MSRKPSPVDGAVILGSMLCLYLMPAALLLLPIGLAWCRGRQRQRAAGAFATAWLSAVVLLVCLVPAFEEIYADISTDLPWPTMILLETAYAAVEPSGGPGYFAALLTVGALTACLATDPKLDAPGWRVGALVWVSTLALGGTIVALLMPLIVTVHKIG